MSLAKSIKVFVLDHHSCALDEIAPYSLDENALEKARKAALSYEGVKASFALSTCNRTELYISGNPENFKAICTEILTLNGEKNKALLEEKAQIYSDEDALAHLFELACGLKSRMIGETEILGQIKNAHALALKSKDLDGTLNRCLEKAIQCAKWVRTNTLIGAGSTTIGAVAAELAQRIFDDISKAKILLAGSGEVGASVAKALLARGISDIKVSSRTWENAHALANEVGASAIPFERINSILESFDIVVCALANAPDIFDEKILGEALLKRKNSSLFFLDFGFPFNVSKNAEKLEGIFVYRLDDLSAQANKNLESRKADIANAQVEIARRVKYLWEHLM